jgi:hypothetical protein
MEDYKPREAVIDVGSEQLTVSDCRNLIRALIEAAEGLERDLGGTVVMRDDRGRELFGGLDLTAEECRALAQKLTTAVAAAEDTN